MASAVAFVALLCACSSDSAQPRPTERAEPETAVGSLSPSAPADTRPADEGRCPAGECPDIMLFGSVAPGCCRGLEACGGSVQIGANSWLCVPPDYDRMAEALRVALAARAGEPLVPDSSCPSETLDGLTLTGCCIADGTCGVSTEPWTAAAAEFGVRLPSVCILASEAVQLAGTAGGDAGSRPACSSAGPVP
jgi:hypothetical protein